MHHGGRAPRFFCLQLPTGALSPRAMGWPPVVAVVTILAVLGMVLGTERLGRALTDEERKRFAALLREHDYPGARLVALRFALKLTRNGTRAQDLMGRADLRLVRLGWDPKEVALVKRLCRLVWSEWTNTMSESDTARRAEEAFLREMEVTEGLSVPAGAPRQEAPQERRQQAEAAAKAHIERLRESFAKAGDEVNLLWLDYQMQGENDLQKMARLSGRDVTDFYRAADRRKRHTRRLLAEQRGVRHEDEE